MSTSVGRVDLDLGMNYKSFNKQLNGISSVAGGMVSKAFLGVGAAIATAFSVRALIDFGKEATTLASSLTEVQNVVDVTFEDMSGKVDNFAKAALYSFGLSELSAKKFTATLGGMFKSAGLSADKVLEMSVNLTALAGDIASFYNLPIEEAFFKLQAGVSGEIEPLRRLGINMTNTNVEAWALTKGIDVNMRTMDFASQTILRYNYALAVTKDQQGDFARTSESWANQVRLMSEQWNIFKLTMGQGFINVLTPILRGLNALIGRLQLAAAYFRAFTELIFGNGNEVQQTAKVMGDAAKSTFGMGEAVEDLEPALKKTSKAAKNALAPFDQLNILTKKSAKDTEDSAASLENLTNSTMMSLDPNSLGMSLTDTITPEIDVKINLEAIEGIKLKFQEIKSSALELGNFLRNAFGPPIMQSIGLITPALENWRGTLVNVFSNFATLGEPFKNWLVSDLTPFLQQVILNWGIIFNNLLTTTRMVFQSWGTAIFPIVEWFVVSGLPLITQFATQAINLIVGMYNLMFGIFNKIWQEAVDPALQLVSKIVVDILTSVKTFWDNWGVSIFDGVYELFYNIKGVFDNLWDQFIGPGWEFMLNELSWVWDNHLKGVVDSFLDLVGRLIDGALEISNKFIIPLVNAVIDTLAPAFLEAWKIIVSVVGTLIGALSDVLSGVMKILGGIIDFIVGVFTGDWSKAWEGVKSIFVGIFDSIVGVLKGAVNLIIDAVNTLIRGMNKIQITTPDWVPGISGKKFGINIAQIPKLASGGLVQEPTLAMVGDNRNARRDPEVVSPLSKLEGMLAKTLAKTNSGGSGEGSTGSPTTVVLKLGETEFGRVVINAINNTQRQAGETLLLV